MNVMKQFRDGLFFQNPVTVQLLGMCSVMAITTTLFNGLGMGLSVTLILICSNVLISLLRKVIPGSIRIAAYVVIISGFVTMVDLLLQAYLPALSEGLGVFIPLIVVNCIILGRAEMCASKNKVRDSAIDGLGMGLGFTLTLVVMGSIREIIGAGSWFGMTIIPESVERFTFMTTPAGGFFTFGILMALVIFIENKTGNKKKRSVGCEGCPSQGACGAKGGCE